MGPGTRRLLRLVGAVTGQSRRTAAGSPHATGARRAIRTARCRRCSTTAPTPRWQCWRPRRCGRGAEFAALRDRVADALVPTTLDVVGRVEKVLAAAHEVELALPAAAAARAGRGDRRRPRAAATGCLPQRLRRRHRGRPSRRPRPLPHRHRPAAGPAAARHRCRPRADAAGARRTGRLRRAPAGAFACPRGSRRCPRHRMA